MPAADAEVHPIRATPHAVGDAFQNRAGHWSTPATLTTLGPTLISAPALRHAEIFGNPSVPFRFDRLKSGDRGVEVAEPERLFERPWPGIVDAELPMWD